LYLPAQLSQQYFERQVRRDGDGHAEHDGDRVVEGAKVSPDTVAGGGRDDRDEGGQPGRERGTGVQGRGPGHPGHRHREPVNDQGQKMREREPFGRSERALLLK